MRFTVVDRSGTTSFAGPGHCLKALVAGCSHGPDSLNELLGRVRRYDERFVQNVLNSLAIFDEQVVSDDSASIDRWIDRHEDEPDATFRVYNQRLRNLSLDAGRLGIVLFNLPEHRIVQIQNAYGELLRKDRGRIWIEGRPVNRYYHYSLPDNWSLLP